LNELPNVREVRRCGFIAGIEIQQKEGTDWRNQAGARICLTARAHGLLTRPIGNVVVLMLPLCVTLEEIDLATDAIGRAISEVEGTEGNLTTEAQRARS
jgi:adenosylmethionine---8-amino-7-oxononanoate aminotransferase